jgi:hypothetical protein
MARPVMPCHRVGGNGEEPSYWTDASGQASQGTSVPGSPWAPDPSIFTNQASMGAGPTLGAGATYFAGAALGAPMLGAYAAQRALSGATSAKNIPGGFAYYDAQGQLVGFSTTAQDGSVVYADANGNILTFARFAEREWSVWRGPRVSEPMPPHFDALGARLARYGLDEASNDAALQGFSAADAAGLAWSAGRYTVGKVAFSLEGELTARGFWSGSSTYEGSAELAWGGRLEGQAIRGGVEDARAGRAFAAGRGSMDVAGAGAYPRVLFRPNPGGQVRTLDEAVELASRSGVNFDPEDFVFRLDPNLPRNVGAQYGATMNQVASSVKVPWRSFQRLDGKILIRVNPNILASDDAIIGTLAHELYEASALEAEFAIRGGTMDAGTLFTLIQAPYGQLHTAAWTYADDVLRAWQATGGM